jgi:hypothetical protein
LGVTAIERGIEAGDRERSSENWEVPLALIWEQNDTVDMLCINLNDR